MGNCSEQGCKGHRWFAAVYDTVMRREERKFLSTQRSYIVGEADGRVLEIGAGTGASLGYYQKAEKVIATEPDPYMLERARQRLQELGVTNVELAQHSAEDLPFDDQSFDHVVSTLVLCTVPDHRRGLAEIRRVLKPAGTFRFIEHVRFDSGVRGRLQDIISPAWRWVAAGCNPNRRTLETITQAGFAIQDLRRHTLSAISPVIVGVARPV